MGNKVNPNGYRLGILHTWSSRWFAPDKHQYRKYLFEDVQIRKMLRERFMNAGLVSVEIERSLSGMRIVMSAVRPGIIIGRGGKGLEDLRKVILTLLKVPVAEQSKYTLDLKIEQFKKPFLSARYTADYIAERIIKNFSHRNLAHNTMDRVMESGAKGVKVMYSGRIRGASIARREKYQLGTVPLSSIREDVDFAHTPALTRNGYVGVKVWICRTTTT